MRETPQEDLVQLAAVLLGLRRKGLAHLPEVGLVAAVLPLQPGFGARSHHVLELAAVPQHQEEVAESGMDVDVLRVFGRAREIDADVAAHPAEAARGVAGKHPDRRLRAHHDVPAELLQHGIARLGDLRDAVLDPPDGRVHLRDSRIHIYRPRVPRFLAPAEMASEGALAHHVVALGKVKVAEVVQGDGVRGSHALRLGAMGPALAGARALFLLEVLLDAAAAPEVSAASRWRSAARGALAGTRWLS